MTTKPVEQKQTIMTADELFKVRYEKECLRVNGFMVGLMIAQWFLGVVFSIYYSPLTWIGQHYEIHVHVWASIVLGGAISGFAILWLKCYPKSPYTRHVVAITQMLWSALLIHLSGGRIETHFHVFASLAMLSIYRDWKILVSATVVVAVDHAIRGIFYPLSAFGIVTETPYRWIEHAAWVLFEVAFLAPGCKRLRNEIYELCSRQVEIEEAKRTVDAQVESRTRDLVAANQLLAQKTEEAEKLALVARYTDNAVMITDEQFRIEWVNEGFTRITGYSREELRGKSPIDFQITSGTASETADAMRAAISEATGFNGEFESRRKNGEVFWTSTEVRPIVDEAGNTSRFITVQSDITDRVAAERENAKLHHELVDASRQAGMAEVATGVLHNVGNVLNSVNVSTAVIRKHYSKSALRNLEQLSDLVAEHESAFDDFVRDDARGKKVPNYLVKLTSALADEQKSITTEFQSLMDNVEHIKEIVCLQQNMAKSKGMNQDLDAHDVVRDVINANKGSFANHHVQVVVDVDPTDTQFHGDKHKLLQILINLVKNAKDAIVEQQTKEPLITISFRRSETDVQFTVKDNGVGISQDEINRIFQHGFTTKKEGHGFGLHSSANAAAELGGALSVTSEGVGTGACFHLKLPVGPALATADSPC